MKRRQKHRKEQTATADAALPSYKKIVNLLLNLEEKALQKLPKNILPVCSALKSPSSGVII